MPVAKSAELLSESAQPSSFLKTALVVLGAGAGAVSKQLAVEPYPKRSTTLAAEGHAPTSAVALLTSATLPADALKAIEPVASGAGSGLAPFALPDSCTR